MNKKSKVTTNLEVFVYSKYCGIELWATLGFHLLNTPTLRLNYLFLAKGFWGGIWALVCQWKSRNKLKKKTKLCPCLRSKTKFMTKELETDVALAEINV